MINCAHPKHFEHVLVADPIIDRVRGLRANASTKSHAELNGVADARLGRPQCTRSGARSAQAACSRSSTCSVAAATEATVTWPKSRRRVFRYSADSEKRKRSLSERMRPGKPVRRGHAHNEIPAVFGKNVELIAAPERRFRRGLERPGPSCLTGDQRLTSALALPARDRFSGG